VSDHIDDGDGRGPLQGLRVLDLSRLYPGAFCTLLLADLGADVVKVEAPRFGDGMRFLTPEPFQAAHVALNRGKRSLQLDLKHPGAAGVLRRLVRDVDVVVESQRPGAMEALGLGFEQLRVENAGLVWCSLTGFGPDGPHADAPGHDITYLGSSGLLAQLAGGGVPAVPDVVLAVPLAALMGAVGILSAVTARRRTGVGARVDASMVDSAMWLLSEDVARAAAAPGPGWGALAGRGVYRCSDGRLVTVASTEARPWAALCAALDVPDLVDHVIGVDEEEATARLAAAFARKPAAEWVRHPGLAGGVGPVNGPADLLHDEHVRAREGIVHIGGTGPAVLANPLRFDRAFGAEGSCALGPPPELGEHTDEVLAAAGFSPAEVEALRDQGVV
jgi:alpha-methylacyl-CoA racemase